MPENLERNIKPQGASQQSAEQQKEHAIMPTDKAQAEAVGRAIYQEKIRDTLEPDDQGKLVVIDIASGDHEIDADHIAALLRLRQRRPNARTWTEGVGHPAAYHMGSTLPSQLP